MNTPCPNCGLTYTATKDQAKQTVTCPLCGTQFVLLPPQSHHGKTVLLLFLAVLLVAGGAGAFFYLKHQRQKTTATTPAEQHTDTQTFQEKYQDILDSISKRDVMKLSKQLKDASPQERDEKGNTLLWYAVASGDPDVVQTLLQAEFSLKDKNTAVETPILEAVRRNDLPMFQFLLRAGATLPYGDCSDTAWGMAAEHGAWKILYWLKLNRKEFAESKNKPTALARAIKNKNVNCVKLLLEYYDLNEFRDQDDNTLTMLALKAGNHELFLDVFSPQQMELLNKQQEGCLHAACQGGNLESVQELLRLNVPLNDSDFATSPLRIAIEQEDVPMVEALLQKGISTQGTDADGNNALMLAISLNNREIYESIAAAGNFDLLNKNQMEQDSYDLAKNCQDDELAGLVRKAYGTQLLKKIQQEAGNIKAGVNERDYYNAYRNYLAKYPDLEELKPYLTDEIQRLQANLAVQDTKNLQEAIDYSYRTRTIQMAYNMLSKAIETYVEADNMKEAKARLEILKGLK